MSAVRYRFRAELRSRWRAWLALSLLVGLVAGVSLVLFAGSRRTGSAHPRFVRAQHAYDVGLAISCERGKGPGETADRSCFRRVARLPAVEAATTLTNLSAFVSTLDGRSLQPDPEDACYSGPGEIAVTFDASGRFGTSLNRAHIVEGRRARRDRVDEAVLSQETARRLHIGPGDDLLIRRFADCEDDRAEWGPPTRVRVVGVQLSPGEVRPPSGVYFQALEVTPAFFARTRGEFSAGRFDYLAVRLRAGSSVDTLVDEVRHAGYEAEVIVSRAEGMRAVQRAIEPNETSLLLLAVLIALAGLAVLGQVLARSTFDAAGDDRVLAALGMGARARVGLAALRGCVVGLGAGVVAVVGSVLVSPVMPIGLARRVELHRGFSVDTLVLAGGVLVTLVFVTGVSAATAVRLAARSDRPAPVRRTTLRRLATGARLSPPAMSGVRFALDRGRGALAVPVVTSVGGLTVAVVAVAGALTFGASLTHLRETPGLVGWNWDVVMMHPALGGSNESELAADRTRVRAALNTRGISDFAVGTIYSPFPGGRDLQLGPRHRNVGGFFAIDGSARVGPSMISGRKPSAPDEILVGPHTLSALGLHVGDTVEVIGQAGTWEAPGDETSTRMRIVGTGLAPVAQTLGRGAVVTLDGLRLLSPGVTEQAWFVRLGPGTDRRTVVDAFRAAFPDAPRDAIAPFGEEQTDPGLNLEGIGSVPGLFAAIMGLMAAGVLAHVLAVAARARTRDLAVLRALGFSRGQVLRTIAWESTTYAIGSLAIGLPMGVVLGRLAWRAYASNLGVVPEAMTPLLACAGIAASALVLAVVLAIAPGVRLSRARPGAVLRTE